MKDSTENGLMTAAGEKLVGKNYFECKVKSNGSTIAIITRHPGISRGLICYSIEELDIIYQAINEFRKANK